jgi:hypothetical protein
VSGLSSSPTDSPPAKRQRSTSALGDEAAGSPRLRRNQTAAAAAARRDNSRCVLTGEPDVEIAHIYPFYSLQNKEEDTFGVRHLFWNCLRMFWPDDKVAAWAGELFPQGLSEIGVERVYNLIVLSTTAHSKWNRGAFALKPLSMSEDRTTLQVQFFWQKKQNIQLTMSLSTTPFPTEGLDMNEGAFKSGAARLFDKYDKRIKSGDVFELQTDDAVARPLPSFQLLEMQWFLTRIVGMAGAASPESDWDDEDSDGMSNLGLGEVEDDTLPFDDPETPELLRRDNALSTKGSEHHIEEMEGGGVRVGGREQE